MNDSKGLLVVSSPLRLSDTALSKITEAIAPLAEQAGLSPVLLLDTLSVSAIVDYTPLLTRLCVAVEALVAQGADEHGSEPSVAENAPQGLNRRG